MSERHEVVIGWGAGLFTFRRRWQAAAFTYLARRWRGWTAWHVLSDDERTRSVKPKMDRRR